MRVGVLPSGVPAGEAPARLRLHLAAVCCTTHTNATFACAKKPCVEVLHHPSQAFPVCVVDLFVICLSAPRGRPRPVSRACFVVLIWNTCFFQAIALPAGDLCAGRGQKRTRRSQLSVTVSALSVCFYYFCILIPFGWSDFEARWLFLKVAPGIPGVTCPQAFTWQPKFSPSWFLSYLLSLMSPWGKFNTKCLIFGQDRFICNQIIVSVYEDFIFTPQLLQVCFQPHDG